MTPKILILIINVVLCSDLKRCRKQGMSVIFYAEGNVFNILFLNSRNNIFLFFTKIYKNINILNSYKVKNPS
ncbi:MAG TPA: hypothetical protein DFI01_04435 [Bacteroidales bacterium]|nr:hypothetical protein [Bacteroidales bacterium]